MDIKFSFNILWFQKSEKMKIIEACGVFREQLAGEAIKCCYQGEFPELLSRTMADIAFIDFVEWWCGGNVKRPVFIPCKKDKRKNGSEAFLSVCREIGLNLTRQAGVGKAMNIEMISRLSYLFLSVSNTILFGKNTRLMEVG